MICPKQLVTSPSCIHHHTKIMEHWFNHHRNTCFSSDSEANYYILFTVFSLPPPSLLPA